MSFSRDIGPVFAYPYYTGQATTVAARAAEALPFGRLVVRASEDTRETLPDAGNPTANAASATSVLATGGASAASEQTLTATDFNGAVGATPFRLPVKATLVLSSSADWNATNATLTGIDDKGTSVSETLAIPDGGGATVTSVNNYSRIVSLVIPAQGGTGGTFTIGNAADYKVSNGVLGVVLQENFPVSTDGIQTNQVFLYASSGTVNVSTTKEITAGAQCYVVVGGVAEDVGKFTDESNANTVELPNAVFSFPFDASIAAVTLAAV